jgi:hypothetical protein
LKKTSKNQVSSIVDTDSVTRISVGIDGVREGVAQVAVVTHGLVDALEDLTGLDIDGVTYASHAALKN